MKNQAVKLLSKVNFLKLKYRKRSVTLISFNVLACYLFASQSAVLAEDTDETTWHHPASPYRAIFSIEKNPTHSQAGIALQVPTCGLGKNREGRDFFAFTSSGNQLPLFTIGRGLHNRILTLTEMPKKDSNIYLYFGSSLPGPQNKTTFRPSLLSKVYSLPPQFSVDRWLNAQKLIEQSPMLGSYFVNNIALAHNPVSSRKTFAVDFSGHFLVKASEEYIFTLISENAGYLLIDDTLLIERGQKAKADRASRRGKSREKINLRRGMHTIRCVTLNKGGRFTAMVGIIQKEAEGKDEKLTLLPVDSFLHSGRTKLLELQTRTSESEPFFDYKILAYIGYEGQFYHLVKLRTLTGVKAEWELDNGIRGQGESLEIIVPGTNSRRLLVKHENRKLTGTILFPEREPPRKSIKKQKNFQRFVDTMTAVPLKAVDTSPLLDYHNFIRYHQGSPKLAETARILNRRNELDERNERKIKLDLVRTVDNLDQAESIYRQLLQTATGEDRETLFLEFCEFLLFRQNESAEVEQIITYLNKQDILNSIEIALLRIDLEMARGDRETATGIMKKILRSRVRIRNQRQNRIQGEALERKFYSYLEQEFLGEARKILYQWQRTSPYHRNSGDFHLARARLFRAYGWRQAALREINRSLEFEPRINRKPQLELEKLQLLRKIGDNKAADELEEEIREQYPNHPAVKNYPE